ncbi:hypothetical protein O181_011416 [Austropuccinia psidii MF-1]|uniref:Uncharacterized protein n=1 Tax=Austropuccinia psidii MF-1 TaxID=1389203 RepID=A0A9Q3GLA9_9BASI|nr:hypothetical protein [Austropuccinia psidii MF-1]
MASRSWGQAHHSGRPRVGDLLESLVGIPWPACNCTLLTAQGSTVGPGLLRSGTFSNSEPYWTFVQYCFYDSQLALPHVSDSKAQNPAP